MSIDPSVIGLGAGTVPPAALALPEPLAAIACALGGLVATALILSWVARRAERRRPSLHLRVVRP